MSCFHISIIPLFWCFVQRFLEVPENKPNHIPVVPISLEILIKSEILSNADMSFLKTIGFGGDKVTEEFENKAESFFYSHNANIFFGGGYGMTENGSAATMRLNSETAKIKSVGIPLVDTIIGVFEPDTHTELKYGEVGEICICSKSLMVGYWNNPTLTEKVIKTHTDGKLWLHSGDLGYIDEDGFVFIKGRIKRIIPIYNGDKVCPDELEEVVQKAFNLEKIAIVGERDKFHTGFFTTAFFVVPSAENNISTLKNDILEWCKRHLTEVIAPTRIDLISELPITENGKVDYRKLEQMTEETL